MATTIESFTSGAGQVLFPFTIEYIAQSDLKVAIDGTDTTLFTFANATTVELNTAPTTGAVVAIRRDTDADTISSEFFPGSSIRAQDLNSNFTQSLYVAQEVIREAGEATTDAALALTRADTALTDSAAAVVTADAASAAATISETNSTNAVTAANASSVSAAAAATDSAAAVTTANNASTDATTALANSREADGAGGFTSAIDRANTAVTTANTALTNSREADGNGGFTSAIAKATTASTDAAQAIATANAASSAASNAVAYTLVADVASISASPSNDDYIELGDSTGVESFTPLSGVPAGFVGVAGLSVRLRYASATTSWVWLNYFANDPEDRYLTVNTPVVIGDATNGSGQITLNCENNSHGVVIKGPPHSAAANYTFTLPNDAGTNNFVLKTNGSGTTSWGGADVIFDVTPQLGGDLDVNGQSIVSLNNTNIVLSPNGTGTVSLSSKRITDLATPTNASDAANKDFVEDALGSVFIGFERTTNSQLRVVYSTKSDTSTYTPKAYTYKGVAHNFLGANSLLHTSGTQTGQPKLEFNTNGHLILSI